MAAATGAIRADDEVLPVHEHCRCTSEPVIRGVREQVQRPTGHDIFESLSTQEQDARLGPAAELVRTGQASLDDLVTTSPMALVDDRITQAPLKALA
jgi:hypothetical protein